MPWLIPYDQGRVPADYMAGANINAGGHYPARRENPWEQAIKAIAPAVMSYLKNQKNDAIANQLMNMQQPPRAEAVDPSLQGAPATDPFPGGEDGMQAHMMYQDMQRREERRNRSDRDPTAGKYPVTMPDGQVIYVTGNEAARINIRGAGRKNAQTERAQHFSQSAPRTSRADINRMPTSEEPIDPAEWYRRAQESNLPPTTQQGAERGQTLDKTPVQVQSVEEAMKLPSGTPFLTPDGRLKIRP